MSETIDDRIREEEKTAEAVVTHVEGHYAMMSCGHCGTYLDDKNDYDKCPKCDYRLAGTRISMMDFGGSDF
jgi:rubrerythrin